MNQISTFAPVLALLSLVPLHSSRCAITIDPELVGEGDSMDTRKSIVVDWIPENAASPEDLRSDSSFVAVQDFDAFTPGENIIHFTDESVRDILITFEGEHLSEKSGETFDNSDFATSGASSIRFEGERKSPAYEIVMRLEFGKYDLESEELARLEQGSKIAPKGVFFAFAGRGDRTYMIESLEAVFEALDGQTISTQAVGEFAVPEDKKGRSGFFAYDGKDGPIGSVEVKPRKMHTEGAWSPSLGIDGIGFTFAE